ncbi:Aspartate aminotransferase [Aquisphaera giovannonii]|uniref:Aminotransferase n=1 Tax=Aquisphaera giovannonii TaxID=406548 RepID=A0A5B9W8K5_9BACT|nr:pyridoxal phosphate-dependent aminotransferase [Aquisphaera giovannonii]QEH36962.1 Aspartate aminotransferase [Aquisphaera giovannonii]
MPLQLAERSNLIEPSATLAMGAEAKRLKAQGLEILDFALGEPDFDTPQNIQDAAFRAIKEGKTHYTPPAGIPELRQAVARHYTGRESLPTDASQVVISNGAKHSIHNALMAVCGHGDEVIIPAPYWVSYSDLVKLTGASPIVVPTTEESGFKLTPDQFLQAVTPRTRLLMLNSPSNPTGVVYSRGELEALADAVLETEVGVLSDEIYEQLTYGDAESTCFAALRPGLSDRTITISGVSKTYAMTGWRIGWSVAPAGVAKFMADLQSQETSNPCSVSQWAALEAIVGPQDSVGVMKAQFAKRREYVMERISRLPDVTCAPPGGAFYAFMNVSRHFNRSLRGITVSDSTSFCMAALNTARVALVMGSAFGAEGYARMSFATSMETIERGFDALEEFLAS